ncbi:sigma-70 family RNA polymerase sigma factor, partial [Candidatus Poribacteria bacterium]
RSSGCRSAVPKTGNPDHFGNNTMRTEDGYIIQGCLDGDAAAFGMLVEKYKKGVYSLAYSKVHNFHDAQDITQEVFIRAYQRLRTLRRWDNVMGWLYRITLNLCKNWFRSKSRRPDHESLDDQDTDTLSHSSMNSYRENQMYESTQEALDSLPEIYREVLTLKYFGGMTIRDMSRFLGMAPRTVDRRLMEARTRLKEEMATMMSATYEQHSLPANFTFRIVEMVKRIKIHAMPRATGLPWGLSLAAGIMIAAMTLGSQMVIHQLPRPLAFPGEIMPEVREIPVDILGAPGTSITAGKQGDIDGGGMDPRNPQNASLLAPAMGGGAWTQKADMPTARRSTGSAVVDGKIYVIGGAEGWGGPTIKTVEEYDPATDTWMARTDMPTSRHGLAVAAVDGIIYAIGGWSD